MNKKMLGLVMAVLVVSSQAIADVNVYSSRKEALIKPLLDQFTEQTGVKVNLLTGKDDALITRLTREGKNTQADILITADAGRLHRAKAADVLQPINNAVIEERVPQHLRDKEGYWVALTSRARPIFYAKDKVDPDTLSTYEALAGPEFKGKICIRSSSNIYNQSLIASMLDAIGETKTQAFAEGLVANMARVPSGGDTDQIKAVAAGVCDIAIANTYYYGRLANSDKTSDQQVVEKVGLFWPNQEGRGTHVNVSGVGITAASKNVEEATQLIEFLLTNDAQRWYSDVNNEYPVVSSVSPSETLESWGNFKADTLNLSILGENNRAAVELMDRSGWQ